MTKIIATLGPVSERSENIKKINQFTNLFRVNGSHADLDWHTKCVGNVRQISKDAFVLLDVPGIKPRTTNINEISLKVNQTVCFYFEKRHEDLSFDFTIQLSRPLPSVPNPDSFIFSIDDGKIMFEGSNPSNDIIIGRAKNDCTLGSRKGLNIPGAIYDKEMQRNLIMNFLEEHSHIGINAIGLSFVQNSEIVDEVRSRYPNKIIVAKIENTEGLKNSKQICAIADAVMIDRGDLSAEIGIENLFQAIIKIAHETKMAGIPLIMATENLSSMLINQQPSKSDVISLSHSIQIGTDAIMLSDETAMSVQYEPILDWLSTFLSKKSNQYLYAYKQAGATVAEDLMWSSISSLPKGLPFILISRSGAAFKKLVGCGFENLHLITDNQKLFELASLYNLKITRKLFPKLTTKQPSELIYNYVEDNFDEIFNDMTALSHLC